MQQLHNAWQVNKYVWSNFGQIEGRPKLLLNDSASAKERQLGRYNCHKKTTGKKMADILKSVSLNSSRSAATKGKNKTREKNREKETRRAEIRLKKSGK